MSLQRFTFGTNFNLNFRRGAATLLGVVLASFMVADLALAQVKTTKAAPVPKATAAVLTTTEAAALRRLDIADDILEQTQRTFKFYLQLMLDVEADKSRTRKTAAISLVSNNIDKLRKEQLPPAQMALLAEIDSIWSGMLRALLVDPNKEALAILLPLNEKLLDSSEKFSNLMAKAVNGGDLVHLIGHQEMLVQRIARNYFTYHAGYKTPEVKNNTQRLLDRFVAVEEQVTEFGVSNPELKRGIELVDIQIIFLKDKVKNIDKAGAADWLAVSKLSDRLRDELHGLRIAAEKQLKAP